MGEVNPDKSVRFVLNGQSLGSTAGNDDTASGS
jgi:hypothetical protein